jgi:hypothetical protein
MNVHLPVQMDKVAFLAWAEGREERYELVDGCVVTMPRPRLAHAMIVGNLIFALRQRLDSRKWTVIAEFGLEAGPRTLRFPDIVVDTVGGDLNDRWASVPFCSPKCFQAPGEKQTCRTNLRSFYDYRRCKPTLYLRSARPGYGLGYARPAPSHRSLPRSAVWMRRSG